MEKALRLFQPLIRVDEMKEFKVLLNKEFKIISKFKLKSMIQKIAAKDVEIKKLKASIKALRSK